MLYEIHILPLIKLLIIFQVSVDMSTLFSARFPDAEETARSKSRPDQQNPDCYFLTGTQRMEFTRRYEFR